MPRAWVLLLLLISAAANGEEWVTLFDGESLDGWTPKIRGYPAGDNFADTFRVEDGAITVAYDGYETFDDRFGHLFYEIPYSHYRLRLQYRFFGEQAAGGPDWAWRNSGVMFHAQPPQSMPDKQDFPISIELQFLGGREDGTPRPTAAMCSPGTEVEFDGVRADRHCVPAEAPTIVGDDWVDVELLVEGAQRAVHYVSGEPVIEYGNLAYGGGVVSGHDPAMKPDGEALDSGYIALQSESHPIQFRRIELLILKGCMDPAATNYGAYFVASDPGSCRY
ncbi:MAG: DUF1080 domain-containing protein [Woeseiaceae bacterium]|nr:DUF1080 domain-containing protein [Woeseiaceae bacterium]